MFTYSEPKQLANGCYAVRVMNEDGSRVLKQLNNVILLSDFHETQVVVFDIGNYMDIINEVDNLNVEASKNNSTSWFGRELAPKTIETAHGSSVTADGEISLHKVKGLKIYNHNKELIGPDSLVPNTRCDVIAELTNLTFTKKSFRAVWKLVQVKLRPPSKTKYTDEYLFQDDEGQAEDETDSDEEMI